MRLQEYTLVVVIMVLLVVGTILKPDTFLTTDNVRAMLTQASVVGVLAIGMTFVIATSGIDLSVGSIVAAAGVAGGLLIDSGDWAFFLGALGFGLLLGTVNATDIAFGKVVALHRHPRHARHRPRPGAADEREAPHQPHRLRAGAVVRDRGDHRAARVDLDLPGRDRHRVGAAQPHALRPPRRVRGREPGGGADRRRPGAPDDLQRLLPLGAARRPRRHPAVGSAGQRLAGVGRAARARRHRRHRHRRHQPGRRAGDRSPARSWASWCSP